jgi:putative heme-binding domain-containing protein
MGFSTVTEETAVSHVDIRVGQRVAEASLAGVTSYQTEPKPRPERPFPHRSRRVSACAAVVVMLVGGSAAAQQSPRTDHGGEYSRADITYGSQLYATQCVSCHGPNGNSVSGVDFRSGRFRNASTDLQLRNLIANGIPAAGMPPFKLDDAELTGIVAYLRNMSTFDPRAVTIGDAARGKALFEGKGACTTCHRVDGRGVGMAPDLGNIGTLRTASALQTSLLDPSSAMIPINRPVRLVTKDRKVFNGRRLNEDTYTVQVMDDQGNLVSLAKSDLREFTILIESPMPPYKGKLGEAEVADLVAYLLSLKGQ